MTQRRRLLINTGMAALQMAVVGGSFFLLYAYVVGAIGKEDFGVWALVFSITTTGSIANLGMAASAVKFVSQYLAREEHAYLDRLMQTAVVSVALVLGIILVLAYPLFQWLLGLFVEPADKLPDAWAILPYAIGSFWLISVGGVFQSCLDGLHRVDLRSWVVMIGAVAYLGFAYWRVPQNGLIGIAEAQLMQAGLVCGLSWIVLRVKRRSLPLVPWRWDRNAFREMLGYSINFQGIAVTQLFLEPAVKALVSRFGGLATLASFEFAYRMVFLIRSLFSAAHQAIVPTIADIKERAPDLLRGVYTRSYRLLVFLLVGAVPLFIVLTPVISRLWIGQYDAAFVGFSAILFVAWSLNLLANPAYFANLGTGELRWNLIGHVVMAVLSGGGGLVLGSVFGGYGVVAAYATGLAVGSLLIAWAYEKRYAIQRWPLFGTPTVWLGLAALGGLAGGVLLYQQLHESWPVVVLGIGLVVGYGVIVIIPWWRHPMRAELVGWVQGALFGHSEGKKS